MPNYSGLLAQPDQGMGLLAANKKPPLDFAALLSLGILPSGGVPGGDPNAYPGGVPGGPPVATPPPPTFGGTPPGVPLGGGGGEPVFHIGGGGGGGGPPIYEKPPPVFGAPPPGGKIGPPMPPPPPPPKPPPPPSSIVGNGNWLHGTLADMAHGGDVASAKDLQGVLSQPVIPGMNGSSPFYGSVPWGMEPDDIRSVMLQQLQRALQQAPGKTYVPPPPPPKDKGK